MSAIPSLLQRFRRVLVVAACAAALGTPGRPQTATATSNHKEKAMSPSSATPLTRPSLSGAEAIRPFRVNVPEDVLVDLRRRIEATRWPDKETVADESQGVPLAPMRDVANYWATEYDWRRCEARLNALPQFLTEIDGVDIHFVHVRSKHAGAMPVIITHGWPGSILELVKLIGPLTDPTAYGGKAEDAFDVVIPSMPGYGFSGKPTTTGWDAARIASAWVVLMQRLGYSQFVAQGTDWGAIVTDLMAVQAPSELLGIHTNMAGVIPDAVSKALQAGAPAPAGLSEEERLTFEKLKHFFATGVAYALEMGTRPQTLYGVADSPIGLLAWIIDHGDGDAQPAASLTAALRTPADGQPWHELTRDDVLDNVTLYWVTNTTISSSRLYWENKLGFFDVKGVTIPTAVSVFPGEFYQAPRSWAEEAYPDLVYYNRVEKGGHFAAWEQPILFAQEMRAGFRPLR